MSKPNFILNPNSVPITFKTTGKAEREHDLIIRFLIEKIYREFTNIVNYDHATLTIPKFSIPLNYGGRRYDISFILGNRLVLIDVETVKLEEQPPKEASKDG